jgi:hypothetical protein
MKKLGGNMYYREMSQEEVNAYISKLSHPSEDFKYFLRQYVLGSPWARSRGEEDTKVWGKLKGDELEIAKNIIISELDIVQDNSYIHAIGYFRDPRAIPVLKRIIDNSPAVEIKLIAAKVLYDWVGYDDYLDMLEDACRNPNVNLHDYLNISISEFIRGLSEDRREYFINLVK